jgi:hypothetical protein
MKLGDAVCTVQREGDTITISFNSEQITFNDEKPAQKYLNKLRKQHCGYIQRDMFDY